MHKKILFPALFTLFIFLFLAFVNNPGKDAIFNNPADDEGIRFLEPVWAAALDEAKKQNKLIFLDAYTTWCGPCKLLKRKTFTDKKAGDFFNDNFINIAVDMEKADGPELASLYGIYAYPSLLILDSRGNIITRTQGFMKPKKLIEFGEYGLSLKNNTPVKEE